MEIGNYLMEIVTFSFVLIFVVLISIPIIHSRIKKNSKDHE